MSTEEALKDLICERYGTMAAFCEKIGMKTSTLASIIKRGLLNANITNVISICQELGIRTDEIGRGRIVPVEEIPHDVLEISDLMSERKLRDTFVTLDGARLKDEERKMFQYAVEIAVNQIRRSRE